MLAFIKVFLIYISIVVAVCFAIARIVYIVLKLLGKDTKYPIIEKLGKFTNFISGEDL
ncbi:hypothetical protein [Microaceticoccus formicicus]|uniref:hypothetical protein n=1 Tax=Microaceticoccus formicicus TaxID=3118105 RepID=UPI003CCFFC27|nr:hypothetical protein VZL98_01910 [Peptoniphilaceae bacterium AMB_02]